MDILEEAKKYQDFLLDSNSPEAEELVGKLISEVERLQKGPIWEENYNMGLEIESLSQELEEVKKQAELMDQGKFWEKAIENEKELEAVKKELDSWITSHKDKCKRLDLLEAKNAELKKKLEWLPNTEQVVKDLEEQNAELREKVENPEVKIIKTHPNNTPEIWINGVKR